MCMERVFLLNGSWKFIQFISVAYLYEEKDKTFPQIVKKIYSSRNFQVLYRFVDWMWINSNCDLLTVHSWNNLRHSKCCWWWKKYLFKFCRINNFTNVREHRICIKDISCDIFHIFQKLLSDLNKIFSDGETYLMNQQIFADSFRFSATRHKWICSCFHVRIFFGCECSNFYLWKWRKKKVRMEMKPHWRLATVNKLANIAKKHISIDFRSDPIVNGNDATQPEMISL